MKRRLSLFLASGFYLGLIPGAPGTYASLATTLIFYLIFQVSHRILGQLHLSAICLIATLGVLTSSQVARNLGQEDPRIVVIDEVAGQLLALFLLPITPWNLILGTILFRIFDIWKPYPIKKLEHLKDGVGIVADDLMAGAYTNLILQLVNRSLRR